MPASPPRPKTVANGFVSAGLHMADRTRIPSPVACAGEQQGPRSQCGSASPADSLTPPAALATAASAVGFSSSAARTGKGRPQHRRTLSANKVVAENGHDGTSAGVDKRKQAKSRNGCITCKSKRLKCDETKPACRNCEKRGVECGGYKKDFKWRAFEEATFVQGRPPTFRVLQKDGGQDKRSKELESSLTAAQAALPTTGPLLAKRPNVERQISRQTGGRIVELVSRAQTRSVPPQLLNATTSAVAADAFTLGSAVPAFDFPSMMSETSTFAPSALGGQELTNAPGFDINAFGGVGRYQNDNVDMDETLITDTDAETGSDFGSTSSQSLIPPVFQGKPERRENFDVDELIRRDLTSSDPDWDPDFVMELPDFYTSDSVDHDYTLPAIQPTSMALTPPTVPSTLSLRMPMATRSLPSVSMLLEPQFAASSPEALTRRFDQQTCGILSIKDGPTENPWRTMIWPLARDSPALYHAIASMTSFHTSHSHPAFRLQGIAHMRKSIQALSNQISEMKFETAIATTLALAFAESWDTHISSGINHIRGAKILVSQALTWNKQKPFSAERLARLQFLCNLWVYMDVIARLTSSVEQEDENNDFDVVFSNLSLRNEDGNLDPLMGAASSLFPIIGRVANLVRKVRRSESNSPGIVSQASDLKRMLETWQPPSIHETPEDETCQPQDSLQTAEAYRWASLLHLHQAVPEVPSEPSSKLAKNVLVYLATVPLSSRLVIVQIYPLLVASCQTEDEEDREWVRQRWIAMADRLQIGAIDRCSEVVSEVWERRDRYQAEISAMGHTPGIESDGSAEFMDLSTHRPRRVGTPNIGDGKGTGMRRGRRASRDVHTGRIYEEFTVRGRLHWLSVMNDWQWEVLL